MLFPSPFPSYPLIFDWIPGHLSPSPFGFGHPANERDRTSSKRGVSTLPIQSRNSAKLHHDGDIPENTNDDDDDNMARIGFYGTGHDSWIVAKSLASGDGGSARMRAEFPEQQSAERLCANSLTPNDSRIDPPQCEVFRGDSDPLR